MKQVLLIDNYDSFTFNLKHYLDSLNVEVHVFRNDEFEIGQKEYDAVVLSPGPGLPSDAGRLKEIAEYFLGKIPVLGVCLGMQAIAEIIGGTLHQQSKVKHGIQEEITLKESILFKSLPTKIEVGLYHSWSVQVENDVDVSVTSVSNTGIVMSFENVERKIYGVQFHPESVLTPYGMEIVKNFIEVI